MCADTFSFVLAPCLNWSRTLWRGDTDVVITSWSSVSAPLWRHKVELSVSGPFCALPKILRKHTNTRLSWTSIFNFILMCRTSRVLLSEHRLFVFKHWDWKLMWIIHGIIQLLSLLEMDGVQCRFPPSPSSCFPECLCCGSCAASLVKVTLGWTVLAVPPLTEVSG